LGALVLACGVSAGQSGFRSLTERDGVDLRSVAAKPGRVEVDPLLKELVGRRLVVLGTDADLAAVVLRLLRKELLAEVSVGYLPAGESSVAALWGLPDDAGRAIDVALSGEVDSVPLVRDDAGGVLVGLGRIPPVRGVAYCDDTTVLRGRASAMEVTPDPSGRNGLVVRVIRRGVLGRRVQEFTGRAVQLGCLPVQPVKNGEQHPRPVTKWTWYRHTEDLRVARGVV
jgi:hypothetical protein